MFVKPSSALVGKPSRRRQLLREREERAVGEVVAVDEEELGVAGRRVVELQLGTGERLHHGSECMPARGGARALPAADGTLWL